jgi:hypothetical protein
MPFFYPIIIQDSAVIKRSHCAQGRILQVRLTAPHCAADAGQPNVKIAWQGNAMIVSNVSDKLVR